MELLDNGCLKILLSEEDLTGFGLTFASLDYENPVARDAIRILLITAREETGFDPAGGLVVEALPVDGGCLMLFTPAGGRCRVHMKRAVGPYIFEVDDADQLLRLADGLGRFDSPVQRRGSGLNGSSLYRFGQGYRLVLYPAAPLPRGVGDVLQEYAHTAGEGDAAAAFTAEHGQPIAIGDALLQLCAALRKTRTDIRDTGCGGTGPAGPRH